MNGMNGMRSSSRAISFLMRTLILASHASFALFVLYKRIIFFLSGHLYKISQQSHEIVVGKRADRELLKQQVKSSQHPWPSGSWDPGYLRAQCNFAFGYRYFVES